MRTLHAPSSPSSPTSRRSHRVRSKWVLTSRNIPHIGEQLLHNHASHDTSLELNSRHVTEAVLSLIRSKVQRLAAQKKYSPIKTPISIEFKESVAELNAERLQKMHKSMNKLNGKQKRSTTLSTLPSLATFIEHSRALRHIAVWPYLIEMLRTESVTLTLEDFRKPKDAHSTWKNAYATNIGTLMKTSPRFKGVVRTIKSLPKDKEGKERKVAIYSDNAVSAGIAYEVCNAGTPILC